ncbi:uncharacterized protein YALI1_D32487g [Yarrowia lipolytica]|uniref:Uncharacterized protein n=1 Tax=Yarrowia lipolytica TaxID=4952 RepID=A0A1D8NG18_YARLL|nr:hypothetical protein YALI1_D32487g [Yarrowia lipolytica]
MELEGAGSSARERDSIGASSSSSSFSSSFSSSSSSSLLVRAATLGVRCDYGERGPGGPRGSRKPGRGADHSTMGSIRGLDDSIKGLILVSHQVATWLLAEPCDTK